ncbi:MAG: SsrA-binding protein SmpB [Bacteroidota bacterium]
MAKEKKGVKAIEIKNRKAAFEYHFLAEFEAGLVLTGTEIKSIRDGNANLKDAYCFFRKGELYVKNMFIAEYKFGTYNNHEPLRLRKLLMKKTELKKLQRKVKEKGQTIIPYRLYLSERGLAKLEIQLSQGKKSFDKRATIKERENKRNLDRLNKMKL